MSIKSDKWIRQMAKDHGMIEPFEPGQVRMHDGQKIVSYGTSSYGYDIRCAPEFKVFTNIYSTVVDPKNFDERSFVDIESDVCIIPPNSFALARTVEYFRIPRNVLTICLGKSTYARCGIIVNVTPFEPEWEGYVTLEFSNTTPLPAKIYAGEGCAQVLFFESDEVCECAYLPRAIGETIAVLHEFIFKYSAGPRAGTCRSRNGLRIHDPYSSPGHSCGVERTRCDGGSPDWHGQNRCLLLAFAPTHLKARKLFDVARSSSSASFGSFAHP
jgi:dCTP deaminase